MGSNETEPVVDPWVTCFLTSMVIRYLDSLDGAGGRMDYHRIMGVVEGFDHIQDPKAFLLDPNNWIPQPILRELIRHSEEASRKKDVTYLAPLAFFASSEGRQPTLMETIARYLGDVDSVIRCSGLWASAYGNYIRMQAFARPDETNTLYVVVRFLSPVDMQIGNNFLVKGNIEAFSKLYPFVETASCEEQYSQLSLKSVVGEFGKTYDMTPFRTAGASSGWAIKERATGGIVATARPCMAGREAVAGWDDGSVFAFDRSGPTAKGARPGHTQ
jgi:hypothetical protein